MKMIGVIAEYNPFHNGHLYHLEEIKKKYPDYGIVLVMTGNFTERGDVSIIDKFIRTEIALTHGVDLVIELPYPFATQSADYFAYGAITLLEKLNCEKVIFGSESNGIDKKILKDNGAKIVLGLDDILNKPVNGSGYNEDYGLLGSNKATEEKVKLFPTYEYCMPIITKIQQNVLETTGKEVKGKELFSGNSLELDEGVTITAKDGGLTEKTNSRD